MTEEGYEVVALSLRQNGAVKAHALPGSVEVVGAQAQPHDTQWQLDATVHGTGQILERARQTARVPGTQHVSRGR
ncbi:hypothetical protein SSP24_50330 [Streptomyces spinoverrucosus]|uniref:Uncharacterized protein n=1 Tax=Streptomyces spinoverrucosus TaxID=284043 RepID=A0A4Y3VMI6_9ACTN|nr:hypothetical protein SSP24_50330 [Streptomyces spinoverrucosus]GHB55006.1 hypothetical protein GCM10010397_26720 [Streptomyces spinoverrucosus]